MVLLLPLSIKTCLSLSYKHLGKGFNQKGIHKLIKDVKNIGYGLNFRLYKLLENKSNLETAYNQIQKKADNLESDFQDKFLEYPIPKAIVEEYNKVFKK